MNLRHHLSAMLVGFALTASVPAAAQIASEWVVRTSLYSVPDTVDILTSAIEEAGADVAAVIDHAAAAQRAGLELPPTTVVIFGNPDIGTPLMVESRRFAIDLPLKVLVWQEGNDTMVGYVHPHVLAARHGIEADNELIAMMDGALANFLDAATAR
jgi:uncharacterized protein (DUF302 family)